MRTLSALLLLVIAAPAKPPSLVCGTERHGWQEALSIHRARAPKTRVRQAAASVGRDSGDIALLYTSGGVLTPRNPFNLASKGVTFTPSGSNGYRFSTSDSVYDEAAAQAGTNLDKFDDDDTRMVPLPFPFPFYGKTYHQVWINSDGNVSFEEGDSASVTKTIGLLTGGPPRIAPLMVDLDPSFSTKGVRWLAGPDQFTVTWLEIPVFGASRLAPTQTFQLRLFPDGRIESAYHAVTATEAIAGIAPGRSTGGVEIVSFRDGSDLEFTAAVAERFSTTEALDTVLLSQRFYQTHDDSYDYLAVYNNLGLPARPFALALELTLRSRFRSGFGDTEVDIGAQYGSASRLQAFLNMGPLTQYPTDPFAPVPGRGSSGDTPLSILAHEVGHLFLALASVRDPSNPDATPMLGAAQAHWAFTFNSDASFLEGNRIEDNGENASPRFRSVATVEHYAPLDQYLMGLRSPEEVPPTFLVRNSGRFSDELPRKGDSFNGNRQNVTVDDIVKAEGRRSPDHTVAQRHFRVAFILLTREGAEVPQADLDKLDRLRREFEAYFSKATGERASVSTSLKRNLQLSVSPASGIVAGQTLEASVSLDQPAAEPLTIQLRTLNGLAQAPAAIVIPAGQRSAAVPIQALAEGVEHLTAEPSDAQYRGDEARLQVTRSRDHLSLTITGGDRQLATPGLPLGRAIEVRASDVNLIPYPGIPVTANVTSGDVEPQIAITGPDGIARFRWTPGNSERNELTATIDSTEIVATATALR